MAQSTLGAARAIVVGQDSRGGRRATREPSAWARQSALQIRRLRGRASHVIGALRLRASAPIASACRLYANGLVGRSPAIRPAGDMTHGRVANCGLHASRRQRSVHGVLARHFARDCANANAEDGSAPRQLFTRCACHQLHIRVRQARSTAHLAHAPERNVQA